MLRLVHRYSIKLVSRMKLRLVRCEHAERCTFAPDSQNIFFGPLKIRDEQTRSFVRSASAHAPAKKQSEKITVGSSGGLQPLDPWIPRPSFEKSVLQNFNSNWIAFSTKSNRSNDFQGIVIPGGIGVGKTRAGLEVPNIVAQHLKHHNKNIKVVWRISLDYQNLYDKIARRNDNAQTNAANMLFGICKETLFSDAELTPEQVANALPISLADLAKTFFKFNMLNACDNAVLYFHIDEFQLDPVRMALLSREVGYLMSQEDKPNVLVILILSGVSSQEFRAQMSPTDYQMAAIQLELSVEPKWINSLVDQFLQRIPSTQQQQIIQFREKSPAIFDKLLSTTGGIPIFVWRLLNTLSYEEASPANAAQAAFELCCKALQSYAGPHSTWFHRKDHAMLFLQTAFFKEHVSRAHLFNSLTVGDLEESGIIYLESVQGSQQFTIGLPLMMLYYHDFASKLNLFNGLERLVFPFRHLDDSKFEEFIAQIYTFSWRLLSYKKTAEVTLDYLHRGCLTASQELLEKKLILPHTRLVGLEQMKALTNHSLGEFQLMGSTEKYKLQSPAAFVLQTRQRFSGADIVIPGQLQVQLKWSQYVGDLQPIRRATRYNDSTYYLTVKLIKEELKKSLPDMPFVIVSPKTPRKALVNACLAGKFPQLCLVTDKNCMQFMEPFYTYSFHPTIENPGEEIQAPEGNDEIIETMAEATTDEATAEATTETPTATMAETTCKANHKAKH